MVPSWLRRLERILLGPDDREFLGGDLEERYWDDVSRGRPRTGALRYLLHLILASSRTGAGMLGLLWNDLRHARRTLTRRPGFALAAILTLAIGIGATTAIFSIADAVLLTPLAYPEPERLLFVSSGFPGATRGGDQLSYLDIREIATRARTLEGIAAYNTGRALQLRGTGTPERVRANIVAPSYLTLLGAMPAKGRLFDAADDRAPNGHPVVIISDNFWRRRLDADPNVVGRTLSLSDVTLTIVGVLDRSFHDVSAEDGYDFESDVFIPIMMAPSFGAATLDDRGSRNFSAIARVRRGATASQAGAEVSAIGLQLQRELTANQGFTFWAERLDGYLARHIRGPIVLIVAASVFVLLIGCSNVANLLLERVSARSRELAVRKAIGAGRRHIVSLLFAESLALAAAGGAIGLIVAALGARAFRLLVPGELTPRLDGAAMNATTLAFASAVTVGVALILSFVAASRLSRDSAIDGLRDGTRGTAGGHSGRTRRGLLVAEVAAAVVLVICAGLMLDSLARLRRTDLGFRTERLITLEMDLRSARYANNEVVTRFGVDLVRELTAIGGVESAFIWGPARPGRNTWITFPGREDAQPGQERLMTWRHTISPGALRAAGIPIVRGRELTEHDTLTAPRVAIVSETLAKVLWPGEDPIGKRMKWYVDNPAAPLLTIVGVAADAKHRGRVSDLLYPPRDVYVPHAQRAERMVVAVVRASADPLTVVDPLRAAIARLDPELPVFNVRTMSEQLAEEEAETRFAALLLAAFGAVALLLAAIGIYGVLSYHVTLRTKEMAVRMALGATRGEVLWMVVRDGMQPALAGIVLGLAGAAASTRFLRSILFRVEPRDPTTFATVAVLLAAVALVAAFLPAARATRVAILDALRAE